MIEEKHENMEVRRVRVCVFRNTKLWCYRILTLLCAVPAGFVWGIQFACLACCTVWCCRPCIRAFDISLSCVKDFYTVFVMTFYRPCYEAMGFCFHNFRIFLYKGAAPEV
nr:hypothetical protein BaRGS_005994 [Batillaria attramentaria]